PDPTITPPVAGKTEAVNPPVVADNIVAKRIRILGVPLDLGQSRRGVDMGPSAGRGAGLEARLETPGPGGEEGGHIARGYRRAEEVRRSPCQVSERNHRHLLQARGDGVQDPGGRKVSPGAGWRPFRGRGNHGGRGGILPPATARAGAEGRVDLD